MNESQGLRADPKSKMILGRLGIPECGFILEPATATATATAYDPPPKKLTTRSYCCCCSQNHEDYKIPKLEAFSRSKFDRVLKDPPLISKSQNQLADYCTLLQGEDSYSCWQAYFELKDLQKQYSKEEVERLIIEAGGVKSLIGCLHGVSSILKANTRHTHTHTHTHASDSATLKHTPMEVSLSNKEHMHIPDGLPKTAHEMEDEENSRMPDSDYTRLLRLTASNSATLPPWYSSSPDHQSL